MRPKIRHPDAPPIEAALMALVDPGLQPVSLTADTAAGLLDRLDSGGRFLVSEKTDGTRAWLTSANGQTALHDRAGVRRALGECASLRCWEPLLLDGELVRREGEGEVLVLFDVHAVRGRDLRALELRDREAVYREIARSAAAAGRALRLEAKPWLPGDDWRRLPCVEGLVWQNACDLREVYKYKRLNSIDLRYGGAAFPTAAAMRIDVTMEGAPPMRAGAIYELVPTHEGPWRVVRRTCRRGRARCWQTPARA